MADLSDVQNGLVAVIAQTLYPNGTGQPSAAGLPCMIYPGWPLPAQLDKDLAAGKAHVSVFTRPEERNTTRYSKDWKEVAVYPATLTLTIQGQTITVGGSLPPANRPENLAVVANGQSFVYAVQPGDTLVGIATALATLIAADIPGTTNTGPVLTLPDNARITAARTGGTGSLIREIRRQQRVFQITVWADTPAHRDAVAQPIDVALADRSFLVLSDQMAARLIYKGSPVADHFQKDGLYRRDLLYTVEYATTQTTAATQIITSETSVTAQESNAAIATTRVNF